MPIAGILCAVDNCQCSVEYCLDCSLNRKNKYCPYPYPLLQSMFEKLRITPRTSVTTIFGCPRQFYLLSTKKYYMDIQKQFRATFGQIVHSELERCKEPDSEVEYSMSMDIDYSPPDVGCNYKFTITGTCDEVSFRHRRIRDWKFTEKVPYNRNPWPKHTQQINVYRHMYNMKNGNIVDNLEVCYISPGEAKICTAKVLPPSEVESALNEALLPFYWLLKGGVVPAAMVEKEDKVLCAWCQVETQCHEEYHRQASIKQIENLLGELK